MKETINKIWCKILELDSLKNNEKFYDVGGNSITFLMIIDEIQATFGVELPITDVYLFDTVDKMAGFIQQNTAKFQED